MAKVQARWLASLSDGTIAIEGKNQFQDIVGQPSPWQRLMLYVSENKLHITGLRIQVETEDAPTRTFNLPSLSPRQKWNPFTIGKIQYEINLPDRFNYFRRASRAFLELELKKNNVIEGLLGDTQTEKFIEIHAIYKDYILVLIVEETEGNESWCFIINK